MTAALTAQMRVASLPPKPPRHRPLPPGSDTQWPCWPHWAGDAETLRDAAGPLDAANRQTMARAGVEAGVSGNSVVTDSACVSYSWSGLSATITFADCELEETGESLTGAVTLSVSFHPTSFGLTFSSLTSGSRNIDGSLTLNVGGACQTDDQACTPCGDSDPSCGARRVSQRTVTGNLTITDGGSTTLAIESLSIVNTSGAGTTVSGTVTSGGITVAASDLSWNQGDCLPSSGTVTLDESLIVTFDASTPTTGNVSVQLPPLPPVTQMLFAACP